MKLTVPRNVANRAAKAAIIAQGPLKKNDSPEVYDIWENNIFVENENKALVGKAKQTWDESPLLHPIMELTSLAMQGQHALARLGNGNKKFKIVVSNQANISTLKQDSLPYTRGIYSYKNTVFAAGTSPEYIWGSVLHEVTHFCANEVFNNDCTPYYSENGRDKERHDRFTAISTALSDPLYRNDIIKQSIPKFPAAASYMHILEKLFDTPDYTKDEHNSELIVRIPQIIGTYGKNGEAWAKEFLPALYEFYEKDFNPQLQHHTAGLLTREMAKDVLKTVIPATGKISKTSIEKVTTALEKAISEQNLFGTGYARKKDYETLKKELITTVSVKKYFLRQDRVKLSPYTPASHNMEREDPASPRTDARKQEQPPQSTTWRNYVISRLCNPIHRA